MAETMTLIATIFEKCTGSNACETFKSQSGDALVADTNSQVGSPATTLLEQTISENEARIAELVTQAGAADIQMSALAEEVERNDAIEEAYNELQREYETLIEESDAIAARNARISNALSATQTVNTAEDAMIAAQHEDAMNGLHSQIIDLNGLIEEHVETITEKDEELIAKNTQITDLSSQLNLLAAQINDKDLVIEERNGLIEEHVETIAENATTIAHYTERFNDLKAEYEELAEKYYVLTHTHHSASAVEIIVPGLTYKPEIAKYVELYGFPEDFVFDDVKLDAIRWDLYGEDCVAECEENAEDEENA